MDKAAVLDVAVTGYFEHRFEVDHSVRLPAKVSFL